MISSKTLKEIVSEARPIIERQLDDAEQIAAFRDLVADQGGDWSALKSLIKAQIQDERDETGDGKRVKKILEKASFSTDYAALLGWSKMNENNFSAEEEFDPISGEFIEDNTPASHGEKTVRPEPAASFVEEIAATIQPETANEVPAQDGKGTGPGESLSGKSNAARPASVDAQPNGSGSAGQAEESVVTVVGTESGTVSHPPIAPASHGEAEAPSVERVSPQADETTTGSADANIGGEDVTACETVNSKSAGALVSKTAPATSGITFETDPPVPMKRSDFAHCFPELSKAEYEELQNDIAQTGLVVVPILRKGDTILDGWARYNIARSLGIGYPVEEYQGSDVLLDVIALQRSARGFTAAQERKIAAELAKEIPHRADDIMAAFQIEHEGEPA